MVWNTRRPRLKNEKHRILRTGWSHNIRNFKLRLVATVFCVVEINVSGNKIPLRLAPWSLPRARELPNGLFPPLLLAFLCRIAERQRGRKGERRKEREREGIRQVEERLNGSSGVQINSQRRRRRRRRTGRENDVCLQYLDFDDVKRITDIEPRRGRERFTSFTRSCRDLINNHVRNTGNIEEVTLIKYKSHLRIER